MTSISGTCYIEYPKETPNTSSGARRIVQFFQANLEAGLEAGDVPADRQKAGDALATE